MISTRDGKTIAGYSAYAWNQCNKGFVDDPEKNVFLLSFDLMKKMVPLSENKLIYCDYEAGPIFGDSDL